MTYTVESLFDEALMLVQAMDVTYPVRQALYREMVRGTVVPFHHSRAEMEEAVRVMPDNVRAFMMYQIGENAHALHFAKITCWYDRTEETTNEELQRRFAKFFSRARR